MDGVYVKGLIAQDVIQMQTLSVPYNNILLC